MAGVRSRLFVVTLSMAVLIMSASVTKAQDADPSLILALSFDDGSGAIAKDSSDYGNDGALKGDPKWVEGKFGKALQFNGSTDWVEIPHADTLCVDKAVTVMAWINAERHTGPAGAGWQCILAKSDNPRSYSFYTVSDGTLHLWAGIGTVTFTKVPLKEWVHVVAIAESGEDGTHSYYINGERDPGGGLGGVSLPGLSDTATVLIGRSHENQREFQGMIDEVRIWNRAQC